MYFYVNTCRLIQLPKYKISQTIKISSKQNQLNIVYIL